MKPSQKPRKSRFYKLVAFALAPMLATSCMTTYDANGQPVQTVDPGVAAAGIAAAAVVGYAAANYRNKNCYNGRPYGYYGGGGYRCY